MLVHTMTPEEKIQSIRDANRYMTLFFFSPLLFGPQKSLALGLFYWAVSRHVDEQGWPFLSRRPRQCKGDGQVQARAP